MINDYVDKIGIETPLKAKYENNILPEIVLPIRNYLFQSPEKAKYYISNRINLDELIKYVASNKELQNNLEISSNDLLPIIIEYVEVKIWKLT